MDTFYQHSFDISVVTQSTSGSILNQQSVNSWQCRPTLSYQSTLGGLSAKICQLSTEYRWRCQLSVDQDVNQGYQLAFDHGSLFFKEPKAYLRLSTVANHSQI